jgi:hypothetical protein
MPRTTTSTAPGARPKLPANLEGNDGLARSRRHREKQALPPGEDRFDRPVDGDLLVVPGRLAADRVVGSDQVLHLLGRVDSATCLIAPPKAIRRREVGDARFRPLEIVDLDDLSTVGSVAVFEPEDFRIIAGLLHGISRGFVTGLRLDYGKREVPRVAQQVVDPLGRLADETLAHGNDAAIRDGALLGDRMRFVIPPCRLQLGYDESSASVGFVRHAPAPLLFFHLKHPLGVRPARIFTY